MWSAFLLFWLTAVAVTSKVAAWWNVLVFVCSYLAMAYVGTYIEIYQLGHLSGSEPKLRGSSAQFEIWAMLALFTAVVAALSFGVCLWLRKSWRAATATRGDLLSTALGGAACGLCIVALIEISMRSINQRYSAVLTGLVIVMISGLTALRLSGGQRDNTRGGRLAP